MDEILINAEMKMDEAMTTLDKRLTNIRAGRANPSILDGVMVSYYGVDTPLKQLATISIPEARQLMIKPFDRSTISDIEKAIYEANVGLTPNNNGETIILNIPALTEETRRDYVKQSKQICEEAKVALRNIRQDAMNEVKKSELTEDDKKGLEGDVQDLINKYNKIVEDKFKEKENELMTV